MFLSVLIVLKFRVEDRGDERGRGPAVDSGSWPGPGVVLWLHFDLMWGAASYGRATIHKWAFVAGSDAYVQRNFIWGQTA